MAGIVQEKMARPQGDELTPDRVKGEIQMPPELQEAFTRMVIGGMKVMFDQKTHKMMLDQLRQQGPLGQRLGEGIAGLVLLLFKESNQTLPPQVLIPAGIELLMQAVEFLRKSGLEEVTNEDIGEGMRIFITVLLEKFGMSADKLAALAAQYAKSDIPDQQGAAPPAPPEEQEAPEAEETDEED